MKTTISLLIILVAAALIILETQTILAIKLSDFSRQTISNGELGYTIGHVQGRSDANNSLMNKPPNYGTDGCIKRHPDFATNQENHNFCVAWALGYAIGWREITGQDIDLPPPFPKTQELDQTLFSVTHMNMIK